jgi:hypothetical protein
MNPSLGRKNPHEGQEGRFVCQCLCQMKGARHPQTLPATHFNGRPLPWIMEHRSVCWCP